MQNPFSAPNLGIVFDRVVACVTDMESKSAAAAATPAAAASGLISPSLGSTVPVFKPVLTEVGDIGYSSGWKENQRNLFTPGALAAVMIGHNMASISEIGELVCHWYYGKREMAAPYIYKDRTAMGFTHKILPKFVEMREHIGKAHPELKVYFDDFIKGPEMKQYISDVDNEYDYSVSFNKCTRLLVEKFGENITILPQPTDPGGSSFTLLVSKVVKRQSVLPSPDVVTKK
jgi:hypothetical protein